MYRENVCYSLSQFPNADSPESAALHIRGNANRFRLKPTSAAGGDDVGPHADLSAPRASELQ
jgi:hypothetical protein